MSLVVDASMSIAWSVREKHSGSAQKVLAIVVDRGAVVPSLWYLEVANILIVKHRRGEITMAEAKVAIDALQDLEIERDPMTEAQAMTSTFDLAVRHGLTTYDAAYLELALRRGLEMATLDAELKAAALAEGVAVVVP